ncbi:MAG: hypothetical protein AB7I27_03850 [Bacteriovoracaceae bacterium]
MENSLRKPLVILNLAGDLSPELTIYFADKNIKVITNPEEVNVPLSHVLVRGDEKLFELNDQFQFNENNIKIISLSQVADVKKFVLYNGLFVFDEKWLQTSLGNFILDKFLRSYASISLTENYPSFRELGHFQIVNPFNTGEYLDRMIQHAFNQKTAALSVKSYFDHFLMYLGGLKARTKVSVPFEVSYGAYEDIFGLQFHFYAKNFTMDDVVSCLGQGKTDKMEESLLRIATQLPDFFDFTYVDEVKKVIVTALWLQGSDIKISHRGIMFNHLVPGSMTIQTAVEEANAYFTEDPLLEDLSVKVRLPLPPQADEVVKLNPTSFTETVAERITSSLEVDKMKEVISGCFDEEVDFSKLSGLLDEDDDRVKVSSSEEMNDIVNLVKGQIDEENEIIKVSGEKIDPDKFALRIAAGIAEKNHGLQMNVKDLGPKIQDTIKSGLFNFAQGLGKSVDSLEVHDLERFKREEVPKLIEQVTVVQSGQKTKAFFDDLKVRLKSTIQSQYNVDSVDHLMQRFTTPEDVLRVKQTLKSTIKESLDHSLNFSNKDDVTNDDVKLVVESLSTTFAEDENKVRSIVTEAESVESKHVISSLNTENQNLKAKIKALTMEVKLAKDVNAHLNQVQQKALSETSEEAIELKDDTDDILRQEIQEKLSSHQNLNLEEIEKLKGLLEREAKAIEGYKLREIEGKKTILELTQKESFYLQDLKTSHRQIKAKEMVITKAKDTINELANKKDGEIRQLKEKLEEATKALANNTVHEQATTIRHLEKQNLGMTRMLEVYKNKLASLATNMQSNKSDDGAIKEEVRKLHLNINQYKNQLELSRKDTSKLNEKLAQDAKVINQLRQDKSRLEQLLKKATLEFGSLAAKESAPNPAQDQEIKRLKTQVQTTENQFREANQKIKDLEAKVVELQKAPKQQAGSDHDSKVRLGHMEASVKKLTQDLMEAKNQLNEAKKENNKLRSEKTAIQNQIDKLKKDAEKNKSAAPAAKKPGSKAA